VQSSVEPLVYFTLFCFSIRYVGIPRAVVGSTRAGRLRYKNLRWSKPGEELTASFLLVPAPLLPTSKVREHFILDDNMLFRRAYCVNEHLVTG
jgi:hypothetical protein